MAPLPVAPEQKLPDTGEDERLCRDCAGISLDYSSQTNWRYPRICLGALDLILGRDECALCVIIRELWEDIFAQQAIQPCLFGNIEVDIEFASGDQACQLVSSESELRIHFRRSWNEMSPDLHERHNDTGHDIHLIEDKLGNLRYWPSLRFTQEDVRRDKIPLSNYGTPDRICRPLEKQCDLESMRIQLDTCIKTHGDVCEQSRVWPWKSSSGQIPMRIQLPAEFRLIDVVSLQITKAPPNPQFVALSYRWDHKDQEHENGERYQTLTKQYSRQLTAKGGIDLSRLPQTIVDAIQVCQALNLRFLWVDSLCIMQDAADELKEQIQRMDAIYSLATITIVEATSSEPRQGLECLRSRSPKQKTVCIDGFRFVLAQPSLGEILYELEWFKRGWTYQELLLSKRLLVFTSSQVHHVCLTEAFAEDTVRPLGGRNSPRPPQLYLWKLPWLEYPDSKLSSPKSEWDLRFSCWRFYDEMLMDYGRRKLTKVADCLAAASGILRTMGRNCNDIFLCGLPEKLFPYCLLWQPMGASHRIETCPSWSWAGWTGAKCNPMRNAIEHGWVKQSNDTRELYKVMSALEDISFVASDGIERCIAQQLAEEEVIRWHHSRFDERSIDEPPTHLGPDHTFIESGYLRFIADTTLLTITQDRDAPRIPVEVSQLRRYRILNGGNWIGTIFLGPGRGRTDENGLLKDDAYPGELERCEFVKLTTICAKYRGQYFGANILRWLIDYDEELQEPKIFPSAFWNDAEPDNADCPAKGFVDYSTGGLRMHNVMWVERSGGMISRKAVGIIAAKGVSEEQWKKETVCLN